MKLRPLIIMLAFALALTACQKPVPTAAPTLAPTAAPTQAPTETPAVPGPTESPTEIPTFAPLPTIPAIEQPQTSSPEALAACDTKKQAMTLQAGLAPDWNTLGIDTCYDMIIDLADDGSMYTGSARITFTNLYEETLNDLVLRVYPNAAVIYGGILYINGAKIGDQSLTQETVLSDGTAVKLTLPQPLEPQSTIVLDLTFSGKLPIDSPGEQTYGIFNLSSGGPIAMLANSYPMITVRENGQWRVDPVLPEGDAVVSRISLYLVELHVPQGWKVASTGSLFDQSQADGKDVYKMIGGPVREFTWAASPAFEQRSELVRDVFLQHWALPDTEVSWANALKVSQDSMGIFDDTFGLYPYSEMDVIALPLKNASGVEYPGLILIQDALYTSTDTPSRLPIVIAHEVAHQWWYGLVGNDVLKSPWQDEALATFSSQIYEAKFDPAYYQGTKAYFENNVKTIQSSYGQEAIGQPVDAFTGLPRVYAVIVYQKGALFFEALRAQIGDEAFFNALQDYFKTFKFRNASPSDLLTRFETTCSCDLTGIYTEWGVR